MSRLVLITLLALPCANASAQQRRSVPRSIPVIVRRDSAEERNETRVVPMARAVPGSVNTLSIEVPRPRNVTAGSATYVMTPAEGVRLFGDTSGSLADAGALSLPITFSVAPHRDAGSADIATVNVTWADGTHWTGTARASVVPRYALRVTLRADGDVAAKGRLLVHAFITNNGNMPDSVRLTCDAIAGWSVACDATRLVVPVGGVAQRTITLSWPATTPSGESRLLRLVATGTGGAVDASLMVRATASASDDDRTIVAATSVFLGSDSRGSAGGTQSMALNSTMRLASDSWLTLGLRRQGGTETMGTRVFAREMNGGRSQIDFRRTGLGLRAGDVFRPMNGVLGALASGQGVDIDVEASGLRFGGVVSEPHATAMGEATDRARLLEASTKTTIGQLGAQVAELRTGTAANGSHATAQEMGVRLFNDDRADRRLSVDVGLVRLVEEPGTAGVAHVKTGPALDIAYDGTIGKDHGTLSARFRELPAVLPSGSMLPSLASLSMTLPFTADIALTAAGSRSTRRTITDSVQTSNAISTGIVITRFGASTQLLATAIGERRTLGASIWVPLHSVVLDFLAQTGVGTTSDSLAGQHVQGGARWTGARGWLWAGLNYAHTASSTRTEYPQLEVAGAIAVNESELEFGGTGRSSFWSRWSMPLRNGFQLVTGVDYSHLAMPAERWHVLAGMKRSLDVPLPIRRPPVISGVVFEDLDGNGRRNSEEPPLQGIVVRYGADQRTTGKTGEFAFADKGQHGDRLDVEATSLPEGIILPPATRLAPRGRADVALVRTATLLIVLRARRPDGTFAEEILSPTGVVVSVLAADGRTRDETPNGGVATFEGLVPGDYDVTVSSAEASAQAMRVTLKPGERKRVDVVPPGGREVRFAPK